MIFDAGARRIAVAARAARLDLAARAISGRATDPAPRSGARAKARARHDAIAAWMARQPTQDGLLEKLAHAKLACAPVVTPRQALESPLAIERALLTSVDDRRGGTRPVVRSPARFSASRNEIRGPAPLPCEHGREILRELLGWDDVNPKLAESASSVKRESTKEVEMAKVHVTRSTPR
jgi:crotonobetainyl-CoA:carnitine CoA-transferase CaiB-like acyl-CoA transferase